MTARRKRPRDRAAVLAVMLAAGVAACGEDDFKNEPREPLTLDLTGVIQKDGVTVSPKSIGAGPVELTVANQTGDPHELILSGPVEARVGPVAPTATGTIRRTLEPGDYEVSAGTEAAVPAEIKPATLRVGPERESASGELQLP